MLSKEYKVTDKASFENFTTYVLNNGEYYIIYDFNENIMSLTTVDIDEFTMRDLRWMSDEGIGCVIFYISYITDIISNDDKMFDEFHDSVDELLKIIGMER